MDPQTPVPQPNIPISSSPVQSVQSVPSVQEKKNNKLLWIIVGLIVLLIGIGFGILLGH